MLRTKNIQLIFIALISFLLSACDEICHFPDVSDDATVDIRQTFYVDATSENWINTGIAVDGKQPVSIDTEGTVYMSAPIGNNEPDVRGKLFSVSANSSSWTTIKTYNGHKGGFSVSTLMWTDTNIYLRKGSIFTITIDEPMSCIGSDPNNCTDVCTCTTTSGILSCPTSCNRYTASNDVSNGSGPKNWNSNKIADNNYLCSVATPNCSRTSGSVTEYGWNIRGLGLMGQVGSYSGFPMDAASSTLFSLANASLNTNNIITNSKTYKAGYPDPTNSSITIGSFDNLKFMISDGNVVSNYNNNTGGYNVYVKANLLPGVYTANADMPAGSIHTGNNFEGYYENSTDTIISENGKLKILVYPAGSDPNSNNDCLTAAGLNTTKCQTLLPYANGNNNNNYPGVIWLRVNDTPGAYSDNSGGYNVTIQISGSTNDSVGLFSGIIDSIVDVVKTTLFAPESSDHRQGAISKMYKSFTCTDKNVPCTNSSYIKIISAMLTLYIMFYGVAFIFGLVQISQMDLVIRLCKIGTIVALIQPGSWDFFNTYLFNFFINGTGTLINKVNGIVGASTNPFIFADKVMSMLIFSKTAFIRLLALIFTSPVGIVYFGMILYTCYVFVKVIIDAAVVYIMCLIATGILISLAPVFIPFILFSMTRSLFDNWLRYLIKFVIEPVMLLGGIGILAQVLIAALNGIINFAVCWKCAFGLHILGFNICFPFYMPWGVDNGGGGLGYVSSVIGMIAEIMFFMLIVKLLGNYTELVNMITDQITQTQTQAGGTKGAQSAAKQLVQSMSNAALKPIGMDANSRGTRRQTIAQYENARYDNFKQKNTPQNNNTQKTGVSVTQGKNDKK